MKIEEYLKEREKILKAKIEEIQEIRKAIEQEQEKPKEATKKEQKQEKTITRQKRKSRNKTIKEIREIFNKEPEPKTTSEIYQKVRGDFTKVREAIAYLKSKGELKEIKARRSNNKEVKLYAKPSTNLTEITKKDKKQRKKVSKEVLDFFKEHPLKKYKVKELAIIFSKFSKQDLSGATNYLEKTGKIRKEKQGKGRYTYYYLPNQAIKLK